jgi:hypothetical protein
MRSLITAALLGLVAAQSNSTAPSITSSLPARSSTVAGGSKTAITVAADGSGQFTAINAAVLAAQNSAIPTVTVLPGTYSEFVSVTGVATITIIGATATAAADWSQNQVTIAYPAVYPAAVLGIGSNSAKGVTIRNINLVNSLAVSASSNTNAVVVSVRGYNIAFYGCSITSPGALAVSSSLGLTFFANSYFEGTDKIFYNVPTFYIYNSKIVPLNSGSSIVFSKGAVGTTAGSPFANSTIVIDSSSIQQKLGTTTSNVYLAAPNGAAAGAVAIYRNTAMGNLIAPAGIHPNGATFSSFYGEFLNTGAGSDPKSRASYDVALSADQVSQYTIDKVYGNAQSPYASTSLAWVDQEVLFALQDSVAAQLAAAPIASSSVALSIAPSTPAVLDVAISTVLASSAGVLSSGSSSMVDSSPTSSVLFSAPTVSAGPTFSATMISTATSSSCTSSVRVHFFNTNVISTHVSNLHVWSIQYARSL